MCISDHQPDSIAAVRKQERLSAILDRVSERGSVDVNDLASALGVSGATVRRDLQTLSSGKLLVRTHGGAVARLVDAGDGAGHLAEKRRIGAAAAALVDHGAVVGFTGGTTALEVARALAHRTDITFVTNAINIASELVGRPGLRLVVIGGIVRSSFELVGPAAEAMLANYHLDIAFIGVDGLTPQEGCTTHDEMEAQTDLAFLRRARRSVVVADSSKIGKVTFARICTVTDVDDIVTDRGITDEQLLSLSAAGAQVTTV
jgi:DeoR family transcriptional regulator of aga operon